MPLLSATRKAVTLAPPLPVKNGFFQQEGLAFRRGQSSLLAAAPGVGKTLFATNLVLKTPIPALYFSADSDEWTVKQRACAILSGFPLEKVEQFLMDESQESFFIDKLRRADHVDWCYQTDIDVEFLVDRLNAYKEMRGYHPELVVIDNLGNTVVDQDNEYAELRGTCREIQRIARTTNAHVMSLHHVKGAKESGTQPIGLGDLLGNIGKIPEQVLGLCRAGENAVTLTVPKNRGGRSGISLALPMHYETATVGGYPA